MEVPAVFNLDEDLQSGGDIVPTDYTQIFVTPAVRLNLFPGTRVSLWVSFGGGFGHFSESNKLSYFSTTPGGSSTTGVIQAGLGLDMRPLQKRFSHFSFRGEVRDFYSGTRAWPGLACLEKLKRSGSAVATRRRTRLAPRSAVTSSHFLVADSNSSNSSGSRCASSPEFPNRADS